MTKDRVMPKALQIEKLKNILAAYNRGVDVEHVIDWEAEVDNTLALDEQINVFKDKFSWYRWEPEPAYRLEEEPRRLAARPEDISEDEYRRYTEAIEGAPTSILIGDYESPVLLKWQQEIYESEFKKRNIPQYEGEYLEPVEYFENALVAPEYHIYRSKKYGYVQMIPTKKPAIITPDKVRRMVAPRRAPMVARAPPTAEPEERREEVRYEAPGYTPKERVVVDPTAIQRELQALCQERYRKTPTDMWREGRGQEMGALYIEAKKIAEQAGATQTRDLPMEQLLVGVTTPTGQRLFPMRRSYWDNPQKEFWEQIHQVLYANIITDQKTSSEYVIKQGINSAWLDTQLYKAEQELKGRGLL